MYIIYTKERERERNKKLLHFDWSPPRHFKTAMLTPPSFASVGWGLLDSMSASSPPPSSSSSSASLPPPLLRPSAPGLCEILQWHFALPSARPIIPSDQFTSGSFYSDILSGIYIFWHSFWHIFWHSFWHIFWHSFWHIFWHSFWHIFWRKNPLRNPLIFQSFIHAVTSSF